MKEKSEKTQEAMESKLTAVAEKKAKALADVKNKVRKSVTYGKANLLLVC